MADKTNSGRAENGLLPMPMPLGFEALMELNRPALAAMAQMNGKVYDNLAAINRNWVSFLNRRLKEELAMPQQPGRLQDGAGHVRRLQRVLPDARSPTTSPSWADDQARQVAGGRHRPIHASAHG